MRRLAYELRIGNVSPRDATLDSIEVTDETGAGTPLFKCDGSGLKALSMKAGQALPTLAGGSFAVVRMDLQIADGRPTPKGLVHRFAVRFKPEKGEELSRLVTNPRVHLNGGGPAVVALPFGDGDWLAANGYSPGSIHRSAMMPINGTLTTAQRYAIDWVKFGPEKKLYHDEPAKNENWYGYGQPVQAVADGTVKLTKDGIAENVPLTKERAVPITLATAGGNCVVQDIGKGRFAFYGHLQPGSLRVKVGQRVRRGDVLGKLGNSGNSDAPHLHFHVSDGPSVFGSQGEPYEFTSYQRLGTGDLGLLMGLGLAWSPKEQKTVDVRSELPYESEVVRVPPKK